MILLDVVLGYGAHPDPAAELAPAVRTGARAGRAARDANCSCVASVTGTRAGPAGLEPHQVETLEEAGVIVCDSNAAAARLTAGIVIQDIDTGVNMSEHKINDLFGKAI